MNPSCGDDWLGDLYRKSDSWLSLRLLWLVAGSWLCFDRCLVSCSLDGASFLVFLLSANARIAAGHCQGVGLVLGFLDLRLAR